MLLPIHSRLNPRHEEEFEAEAGCFFCAECDDEVCDYKIEGSAYEYDTGGGGYFKSSECCGAELYEARQWDADKMGWSYAGYNPEEYEPDYSDFD